MWRFYSTFATKITIEAQKERERKEEKRMRENELLVTHFWIVNKNSFALNYMQSEMYCCSLLWILLSNSLSLCLSLSWRWALWVRCVLLFLFHSLFLSFLRCFALDFVHCTTFMDCCKQLWLALLCCLLLLRDLQKLWLLFILQLLLLFSGAVEQAIHERVYIVQFNWKYRSGGNLYYWDIYSINRVAVIFSHTLKRHFSASIIIIIAIMGKWA